MSVLQKTVFDIILLKSAGFVDIMESQLYYLPILLIIEISTDIN